MPVFLNALDCLRPVEALRIVYETRVASRSVEGIKCGSV